MKASVAATGEAPSLRASPGDRPGGNRKTAMPPIAAARDSPDAIPDALPPDPTSAPPRLESTSLLMWVLGALAIAILAYAGFTAFFGNRSATPRLAIVDVQSIELPYLELIQHTPSIDGPALGTALGTAIHQVSAAMANDGYVVLNGDDVLARPDATDMTAVVKTDVASQLLAQNPSWALTPSALNDAPPGAGSTPGAAPTLPPPSPTPSTPWELRCKRLRNSTKKAKTLLVRD